MVLAVVRVVQRQSLQYVLSAVFPTAIAAFFALRSGRAAGRVPARHHLECRDARGGDRLGRVRWPLVGFMVGAGDPRMADDPVGWHRDRGLVRVCQRLTLVLVGLFVVRLLIMVPLYLAGQVALLGVAKVVLGWPLWLAGVGVMGLMLVKGTPRSRRRARRAHRRRRRTPSRDASGPSGEPSRGHSSLRGTR